ncbi:MAG: mitochondrial escape protein 2 [Cyphobasidiales sp. Tagirdzhanova-0007]|nr:MAG: mitochondrial escape protein 2 [Cyphobasidiales sp. Tagirdzhanova-0007]
MLLRRSRLLVPAIHRAWPTPTGLSPLGARSTSTTDSQTAALEDADSDSSNTIDGLSKRKIVRFYVDTVFPIRLVSWDPRYLLAQVERESLLDRIRKDFPSDATGHGFRVEGIEARVKDGGAFVRCSYRADEPAPGQKDTSLPDIEQDVIQYYNAKAERPWYSWRTSQAHLVKGRPWQEDILNRFPSNTLHIEFESGPELTQEQVFNIFRPYGRIKDLEPQPPSSKDLPRFANVTYISTRMAAAARNSLYGYQVDSGSGLTSLRILYKERLKSHASREWVASHPRIVIPIVAVLAGGLSYAIFDPIRAFFVKSKVSSLFSFEQYRLTKWLKRETVGRLGNLNLGFGTARKEGGDAVTGTGIERERTEAAERLKLWLNDLPDTFITVTGPPGSGKSDLVHSVTSRAKNVLNIDCAQIVKEGRGSDSKLVAALASQMGYFPTFQWASSFNNLIDIASIGLIGTKAGFSTSVDVQIKQVLDVSASALKSLADEAKDSRERASTLERQRIEMAADEAHFVANVRNGMVHDGRLDCVSASGIMGELGMGLERSEYYSEIYGPSSNAKANQATIMETEGRSSTADIDQMPIIIIKGFDAKDSGTTAVLWTAMADWAATLVENRIAHCIFINDNVVVPRSLARALPSKPFSSITLTDATSENALQYVQKKLKEYGKEELAEKADLLSVARLGGRLTDLETLIQKIRGGASIEEAVDDIITRSATEIVKNCFGDDAEEAKSLPWTREQVWFLVRNLSKQKELSYADLLAGGPFKDQEKALRALEQAEIVVILHREGKAATVRPGKPSYRAAFQGLFNNVVFAAQNELALNTKAISAAQMAIKSGSDELVSLSQLFSNGRFVFGNTPTIPVEISIRVEDCLQKIHKAQDDLVKLGEEAKLLKEKVREV